MQSLVELYWNVFWIHIFSHYLPLGKRKVWPFPLFETWLHFSQSCFMQSYINKHCLRNINAPLVQNSRGHLLARRIHCPKFRDIPVKGSTNIEWINFFKDQQFDLDLWPSDLKTKGVMYSAGASIVPSLVTFKQGDQEILSGEHFFKDQQFWHWPLTMWPQNQYGSCTPQEIPLYQIWQLSAGIAWCTDQPTNKMADWQMQNNMPLFFKGE